MPTVSIKGVKLNPGQKPINRRSDRDRSRSDSSSSNTKKAQTGNLSPIKRFEVYDCHCSKCSKGVGEEDSIQCDRCQGWVHFECSGMSATEFKLIQTNNFEVMKFCCNKCDDDLNNGKCNNPDHSKTDSRLDNLTEMVKFLQSQNDMILKMLKEKEPLAPVVWPKVEHNIQSTVVEVLDDQREKEEKKLNVIIYNLPESEDTLEGKDNIKVEQEKVIDILTYLHPDIKPSDKDPNECDVTRLGRKRRGPGEKPRPVKVTLNKMETKEKVLRNARQLKDYKIPRIGLSHDKTKKEMEADRKLKSELMKKREENPSVEFQIFNKEIMTREEANMIKQERDRIYKERLERAKLNVKTDTSNVKTDTSTPIDQAKVSHEQPA